MSDSTNANHIAASSAKEVGSTKNLVLIVYILYAVGLFIGLTGLIGVIIAHVKRGEVAGTWIESHYRWLIRTFWFALLWGFLSALTTGLIIGYLGLFVTYIWLIYRIMKGILRLSNEKPMYQNAVP